MREEEYVINEREARRKSRERIERHLRSAEIKDQYDFDARWCAPCKLFKDSPIHHADTCKGKEFHADS